MHVLVFLNIAGEDVHEVFGDACENDAFNVTVLDGKGHVISEPLGELLVIKVANGNDNPVSERQGALVCDGGPVASGDEG